MGASPWDSAVGSGPYSHFYASQGLPEWSTRTLEAGDIFTVDTYGSVEGYLYDISRSCVCGEKATPDQLQVLEGGVNCVNAIIDVVKPGVPASKLFEAGMQSMIDQGFVSDGSGDGGDVGISYAELFPAFGHGYGLALEAPWLVVDEHAVLEENMALAIETLAGRPGIGGAKFEQNVIVRADGAELVSPAPTHWWTG
jgi:Xaa-Pro aminopeptidase